MKYLIRYYINGDKTRFFETEIDGEVYLFLSGAIKHFEDNNPTATIQKIVKQ